MVDRELKRRLRALGFVLLRQGGRHAFWGYPDGSRTTSISRHRGEIPPGTLSKILRDLGIPRDDFEGRSP
ncbi:MAG TPA: type II toxin-antitoxin system HicA family toxin [Dehalococcoidia bacterium]|nr:type II toxin-antitoxin system HicA family toxin [Dehalococcoidia bacterium]